MKLIKRGIPQQPVLWEGVCPDCGSIYEATREELLYESPPPPVAGRYKDGAHYALCEVCGRRAYFKAKSKEESKALSDEQLELLMFITQNGCMDVSCSGNDEDLILYGVRCPFTIDGNTCDKYDKGQNEVIKQAKELLNQQREDK